MKKFDESSPIRVAVIMGKMLGGGVESVVMNYYKHLDKNKIQFDFICDEDSTDIPYDTIKKMGGKVILVPPYQKVFGYHKKLKEVLITGKYKIVHSHINTLSVFSLFAAWRAKVPIRIAHSHSTTNKKEWKKNIIKIILRPFTKLFATNYMACTEHAGKWMFGTKKCKDNKLYILKNAIDLKEYEFSQETRKKIRKALKIDEDTLVIGNIGRFVEQKNHDFLIEVFYEYQKQNNNSVLILIGKGPLFETIKEKVKKYGLEDKVYFLGQKENANEYYNAFDVFLFPSLYEGLGMVLIEAQVSGLLCITSSEVPKDTMVTKNIKYINLNDSIYNWVDSIKKINKRQNHTIEISKCGYNINNEVFKLEEEYRRLINEK